MRPSGDARTLAYQKTDKYETGGTDAKPSRLQQRCPWHRVPDARFSADVRRISFRLTYQSARFVGKVDHKYEYSLWTWYPLGACDSRGDDWFLGRFIQWGASAYRTS